MSLSLVWPRKSCLSCVHIPVFVSFPELCVNRHVVLGFTSLFICLNDWNVKAIRQSCWVRCRHCCFFLYFSVKRPSSSIIILCVFQKRFVTYNIIILCFHRGAYDLVIGSFISCMNYWHFAVLCCWWWPQFSAEFWFEQHNLLFCHENELSHGILFFSSEIVQFRKVHIKTNVFI